MSELLALVFARCRIELRLTMRIARREIFSTAVTVTPRTHAGR